MPVEITNVGPIRESICDFYTKVLEPLELKVAGKPNVWVGLTGGYPLRLANRRLFWVGSWLGSLEGTPIVWLTDRRVMSRSRSCSCKAVIWRLKARVAGEVLVLLWSDSGSVVPNIHEQTTSPSASDVYGGVSFIHYARGMGLSLG